MNVGGTRIQLSNALKGSRFPRKLVRFSNGDITPYFVVADLSSNAMEIVRQTAGFMQACARVRASITDGDNPEFLEAQENALLLEESMGVTTVPPQAAKSIERVHAKIWHAVRKDLEGRGFTVANQRVGSLGPDLYTTGSGLRFLIEIKTAFGASDYMKAVGQLLIYEKSLKRLYRKILVLPKGLRPDVRSLLLSLDILVVDYGESKSGVAFEWSTTLQPSSQNCA
jgi:hypothetical protein